MTLFWLTLLSLHQGYGLVPVVTVILGEPVTLTCAFTDKHQSSTIVQWYKQSAGDTLKLIASVFQTNPKYEPEFSPSRYNVAISKKTSNLTISRTVMEDEGMYHCTEVELYSSNHFWIGTYLSLKGKSEGTTNFSVVQQSTVSHPGRPADTQTLQCSFLSSSENTACSGDPDVFWFRASSDKSFPDIIYTDEKKSQNCGKTSDSQKSCVYKFPKNTSSSDAETYYCAVATCGQILFGNEMNPKNGSSLGAQEVIKHILFLSATLAICLICMAVLIYSISKQKHGHCHEAVNLEQNCRQKRQQKKEDRRMYSVAIFTMVKMYSETKKTTERQRMFAAFKAFGL